MKNKILAPSSDTCCFVVHAIQPYLHDVMQLLALPPGLQYRLRYDLQWVEAPLVKNIEQLQGKEALVIFYDDTTKNLFPLRWSTITIARQVGRIFYFELMLQGLPSYKSELEARNAQVSGFNTTFNGFHHDLFIERNGQKVLELCVFLSGIGQHVGTTDFSDLTNWGNVVDAVGQTKNFERAEFIKILDLIDSLGCAISPRKEAYSLKDGKTYTLRVFQIIPNAGESRGEPHDIELRAFSDQIQVLRQRQRAVGKYDVLTWVLKVSGLASGERTALELVTIPSESHKHIMTGLYLPVFVAAPSLMSVVSRVVFALVGLALIFLPIILGPGTWESALSFVGMIAFVLSIAGWRPLLKILGLFKDKH
ncbi:hypothetical protein ES703_107435 [subsurface metagenome]